MTRFAPPPDDSNTPAPRPEPEWVRLVFARANPRAAVEAAQALAVSAAHTIAVSRTLAEAGRGIDLSGLDQWIGRLVASALDLDPPEGRELRPALMALLDGLDRLQAAMSPTMGTARAVHSLQ